MTEFAIVDLSQDAVSTLEEILEPDYVDLMQVSTANYQPVAEVKVNPRQVSLMARASNTMTTLLIDGQYLTVQGSMEEVEAKLRGILPEGNETANLSRE